MQQRKEEGFLLPPLPFSPPHRLYLGGGHRRLPPAEWRWSLGEGSSMAAKKRRQQLGSILIRPPHGDDAGAGAPTPAGSPGPSCASTAAKKTLRWAASAGRRPVAGSGGKHGLGSSSSPATRASAWPVGGGPPHHLSLPSRFSMLLRWSHLVPDRDRVDGAAPPLLPFTSLLFPGSPFGGAPGAGEAGPKTREKERGRRLGERRRIGEG